MSKPNILLQILDAVTKINTKVDAVQTQLNELEESSQPLDGLPAQLTSLLTKVSEIQSILSGETVPELRLKSPIGELDIDIRRKRNNK